MSIQILYFASLREAMGRSAEELVLPPEVLTVGQLQAYLVTEGRPALARVKNLRVAVNQDMATADTPVRAGDEVAFFPPVTGG